jgi:hypothetical protein
LLKSFKVFQRWKTPDHFPIMAKLSLE